MPARPHSCSREASRLVVPASPNQFGMAATLWPSRRVSSKLRPREEVLDLIAGRSNDERRGPLPPSCRCSRGSVCKVCLFIYGRARSAARDDGRGAPPTARQRSSRSSRDDWCVVRRRGGIEQPYTWASVCPGKWQARAAAVSSDAADHWRGSDGCRAARTTFA